jgi:hypothetical protein
MPDPAPPNIDGALDANRASESASTPALEPDDLLQHPAVKAWSRLQPERLVPSRIETLKRRQKSAIYRLRGVGPEGSAVIAKRCLTPTALTERTVYQQILPSLPLPALRFYGYVEDDAPGFQWLFMEDAGSGLYSPGLPGHCAAAVRWLALLHTSAARLPLAATLPERGPRFYLEQLRLARENIIKSFSNPALLPRDFEELKTIQTQCDFLEQRWDQVEYFCHGLPSTVVHGDLKAKNFRVRSTRYEIVLLAFDWELAGWGVPATDLLKCPDLALYGNEARKSWPQLTGDAVAKLAEVGKLFRALISIYWESLALYDEWVEWPVVKVRVYRAALGDAIQSLGIA